MISINQTTIYFNIAASIIFVSYIILNSIQPFLKKKVEIEKKNKVSNKVMTVNFKNDLIIREVALPELEKRNLSIENKKNLKLSPLKNVLKNKDPETLLYLTKFLINPNVGVTKKINMSIKHHKINFTF